MLRTVRLGFNVLSFEEDAIFFHDPYRVLKLPAFSQAVVMMGVDLPQEPGGSSAAGGQVDELQAAGSMLYIQVCVWEGGMEHTVHSNRGGGLVGQAGYVHSMLPATCIPPPHTHSTCTLRSHTHMLPAPPHTRIPLAPPHMHTTCTMKEGRRGTGGRHHAVHTGGGVGWRRW